MPRTKVVKKKPAIKPDDLEIIDTTGKQMKTMLNSACTLYSAQLSQFLNERKMKVPIDILTKVIQEVIDYAPNISSDVSTVESKSRGAENLLESTKYYINKSKKTLVRSSSFADDEGYLTAESTNGTSGGRQSRARGRTTKEPRSSRSLSTRKASMANKYKTPANKAPPKSYGLITPKVAPNTPQVLLRRPNQGEVALSLQGSPLFTGSVVSESIANINIPLEGGRLLSIQPQRGLRVSQIPELDLETKRQLETLRDNLNKVCAAASRTVK